MDVIRRKFRGEEREFIVYSQSEADDAGIKYSHWKEAKEGEWALSDDGYVGECLSVMGPYTNYQNYKRYFMVFSYGKAFKCHSAKLNFLDHKATNSYCWIGTNDWATKESRTTRGKRFITAYVMMFMAGESIDWKKLGLIYRPDRKGTAPARVAKRLFKQEAFKEMIQQKMIEVFKGKNISEEDVIEMFQDALAVAKDKKDAKEMRKVAEDFRDMFDMNPKELPRGSEVPYIQDAVVEELQADIDSAKALEGPKKALPEHE